MRILVVDDNAIMVELLGISLTALGHDVDSAEDGMEAIARLEGGRFDVVITDAYMPRMTGFDLCRFVKSKFPSIFVIGMTGSKDFEKFKAAGADIYFVKPFQFFKVKEAIEDHFYRAVSVFKTKSGGCKSRRPLGQSL